MIVEKFPKGNEGMKGCGYRLWFMVFGEAKGLLRAAMRTNCLRPPTDRTPLTAWLASGVQAPPLRGVCLVADLGVHLVADLGVRLAVERGVREGVTAPFRDVVVR